MGARSTKGTIVHNALVIAKQMIATRNKWVHYVTLSENLNRTLIIMK